MHRTLAALPLALVTLLVPACKGSSPGWNNQDALAAESVEIALDANARPTAVEYHVLPETVPPHIMAAMDALHPGGHAIAAEKEYVGSQLYWEVTKLIAGREIEVMFEENGTLHSQELEVSLLDVPELVQAAAETRLRGRVTKWEEIRDGEHKLIEYHAKVTVDGRNYKLMISTTGDLRGAVREVPAEIEVPLP